jgi:hypothetical protein
LLRSGGVLLRGTLTVESVRADPDGTGIGSAEPMTDSARVGHECGSPIQIVLVKGCLEIVYESHPGAIGLSVSSGAMTNPTGRVDVPTCPRDNVITREFV